MSVKPGTQNQKEKIIDKLEEVVDPELNISIVDLGLIYDVSLEKNNQVRIKMTLTSFGCPLFSVIESDIKEKLRAIGYDKVKIDLVFDPPWTIERLSERAKAMLGI